MRGISVTQGIDTNSKTWKGMTVLHGLADDLLLEAISDHVRSGLKQNLFVGLLCRRPDARLPARYCGWRLTTNRGLSRTMPQIREDVAKLIRLHYEWIATGCRSVKGWSLGVGRRSIRSAFNAQTDVLFGLPALLSNPLHGAFGVGRHRNVWKRKLDYTEQVSRQPDTEVVIRMCEEGSSAIIDDELFFAVQQRLERLKTGPRGRRRPPGGHNVGLSVPNRANSRSPKKRELSNLVTECFAPGAMFVFITAAPRETR